MTPTKKMMTCFLPQWLLLLELFVSACGKAPDEDLTEEFSPSPFTVGTTAPLQLTVEPSEAYKLNNYKLENSKFSVSDCKSGFNSVPVIAKALRLYPGDYGCLVKLAEFEQDGETYLPSESDPFTTWLPGDTALFQSRQDPSKVIAVRLVHQVSSPLLPTDRVTYKIANLVKSDAQPISTVTEPVPKPSIMIDFAPQFKISSILLLGIDGDGKGRFQFELQCNVPMIGKALAARCGNVPLGALTYILTQDLWNGSPTVFEMVHLFSAGFKKISGSDVISPSKTKNGGFRTKSSRDKDVLIGPAPLSIKPKMLLILRNASGGFKTFRVGS